MSTARLARIADQIQRELSELIREELRDPGVKLVTVTGVELSGDQSHAKIFFTTLGSSEDVQACGKGLARAAGFLRAGLAHRLSTRTVPELHFAYDDSIERGVRLSRLIDEAVAVEEKGSGPVSEALLEKGPDPLLSAPPAAPSPATPRRRRPTG